MKHTKGPLRSEVQKSNTELKLITNDGLIAAEYSAPESEELSAEDHANFALYASSPTLLEALEHGDKLLTQCLTILCDKAIENRLPFGFMEELKAYVVGCEGTRAIRQAKGE